MTEQSNIDIVVELIGGSDGLALQLALKSLRNGKYFITANKALIAKHGVKMSEYLINIILNLVLKQQ